MRAALLTSPSRFCDTFGAVYSPCLRIAGSTSDVTQRLNALAVQAGLVDDNHVLLAAGGRHFADPFIFKVNVFLDRICGIAVTENSSYVLADKPRLAVSGQRADLAELVICENLNFFAHCIVLSSIDGKERWEHTPPCVTPMLFPISGRARSVVITGGILPHDRNSVN